MKTTTLIMRRNLKLIIPVTFIILILISCEGSDVYRGEWKAIDTEGEKAEILFTADQITISPENGEQVIWEYSQNSVSIENGRRSYGINVDQGASFRIVFPIKNDQEKGAIADQNNRIVYIIGRNNFYTYEEVFGLN
jgi:hypothetical protein